MRTTLAAPTLLGLAVVTAGCFFQTSVHPFLAPEDGVVLPTLAGEWVEAEGDDPDILEFTKAQPTPGDTWTLRLRDKPDTPPAVLTVRLGHIGEGLYWDMTVPEDENEPALAADHRLPLHSLARVRLDGERLEVAFLEPDWFKKRAAAGELAVAHLGVEDDEILLTAPTKELQAAVLELPDDAFGAASVFVRRAPR